MSVIQVRSPDDVARLRDSIRPALRRSGVSEDDVAGFVLGLHEVVCALLGRADSERVSCSWSVRERPRPVVMARVELLGVAPERLEGPEMMLLIVEQVLDSVAIEPLIGGAAVDLRRVLGSLDREAGRRRVAADSDRRRSGSDLVAGPETKE